MTKDEQAEAVLQRIATQHYVTVARMRSEERNRWVSAARQAAAIELMKLGYNSTDVGRIMNRHPTTILAMQGRIGNRGGTCKTKKKSNT